MLTLSVGARYSAEEKEVQVRSIGVGGCNLDTLRSAATIFADKETGAASPRASVSSSSRATTRLLYRILFAKGFRSGGYNFRNLNPNVAPGPFDQEKQDAYENGLKQEVGAFRAHQPLGLLQPDQRHPARIPAPFAPFGNFQIITNAADVSIKGIEGRSCCSSPSPAA